jgi:hypothetical protein
MTFFLDAAILFAHALTDEFALELSEREQDVQRQPPHAGGGIELLGDRDERHRMLVEQLHELGEIGQRSGQPVHLVDDDDIDLSATEVAQQRWSFRSASIAATIRRK